MKKSSNSLKDVGLSAAVFCLGSAFCAPTIAMMLVTEEDMTLSVDTTLSAGIGWRASDINYESVGSANADAAGENKHHMNNASAFDNSDLRWAKGKAYSEVIKGSIDIQAEYKDYGAFVRGKFFYDNAIVKDEGGTRLPAFYPKTDNGNPTEPDQDIGKGGEILDAFVWANGVVVDQPYSIRLGKQVVNWGEGILFQNGISAINPLDVNAILTPGAEIKEALLPVKMLYGSLGITDALTAEVFYQFEWEKTRTPDCGTFFNYSDVTGETCEGGSFGQGQEEGSTYYYEGVTPLPAETFRVGSKGALAELEPDDGGEYGVGLRYFYSPLEMDLGAYFINYHSRLPLGSAYTPDAADMAMADGLLAYQLRLGSTAIVYEYPEDIQLFGLSASTNIDFGLESGATAVATEISYRRNQPLQIEDSVWTTGVLGVPTQLCRGSDTNNDGEIDCYDAFGPNQLISGVLRTGFYQAEVSFLQFFNRTLGADKWTVILDFAFNYADIPDKSELLMDNAFVTDIAPAWTDLPATHELYAQGNQQRDYYPTRSSWGYKVRVNGDYLDAFAGVNLVPTISFSHDVSGNTPGPVSNFLEDRKSLGLSLEANFASIYSAEVAYTNFFGAEPYNQLNDRDYYTISTSVSF